MKENKTHWYDGKFYDTVIAPNQDKLFEDILNLMGPGKTVIDVGCGTGRFSFLAAGRCKSVLGIDLSEKNITRAVKNLGLRGKKNITFEHTTVEEVKKGIKEKFDFALLTYVIHEVKEEERIPLLNEIFNVADRLIIGDYLVPAPAGLTSLLNEAVEFLAGKEHYAGFKSFKAKKGINGLAEEGKFKVVNEIKNSSNGRHIIILEK